MSSTTSNPKKNIDWHMSKFHEVVISSRATKEEKRETYAAWAPSFDEDVLKQGYSAPQIVAEKLFGLCNSATVSVLDIGCGTGLFVPVLVDQSKKRAIRLTLDGLDFCDDFLDIARGKGLYSSLISGDFTQPLSLPNESYDFVIAGGVFVEGHTEPNIIPNVLKCLKSGGYAIFTVRQKTFAVAEKDYYSSFSDAQCTLVEMPLLPYLGPLYAYYVILRKR